MNDKQYTKLKPNVQNNENLRIPQKEGYNAIAEAYLVQPNRKEVSVVLPVGCGKSGLISITPFAVKSKRCLIVAPGLNILRQLLDDLNPNSSNYFYTKRSVLDGNQYPEPAEIRGTNSNLSDLNLADVVITNIHQLQGAENRLLDGLPSDFFDLILFDEGHHNVAESWSLLKTKFPQAKIVSYSATPTRTDGQLMDGEIIYSYPIFEAINNGYVKRLKAVVLNPQTLTYIRNEDGREVEVSLDEVRRLGESDASFRRSIVSSTETLSTIVDASLRQLEELRKSANEARLKIIASALNRGHCAQIVEAYRARGFKADYVHSKEDSKHNEQVLKKLENHELDVIVQVKKLTEGFDHPFLSVAAVFSVFSHLSPFAQFVGRIMRVVDQNKPTSPKNRGVVVFHAGANVANRWEDFQRFSQADQEWFEQLLPLENLDFNDANELEVEPRQGVGLAVNIKIQGQQQVTLEEIPLLADDSVKAALDLLAEKGVDAETYKQQLELRRYSPTKQASRQAARTALDDQVKTRAGQELHKRNINPEGRELDIKRLGKSNFVVIKSAIDKTICDHLGKELGKRAEYSQIEITEVESDFDDIVSKAISNVFGESSHG